MHCQKQSPPRRRLCQNHHFGVENIRKQIDGRPSTPRQSAWFLVRVSEREKVGLRRAAIGALADIPVIVRGEKGTILSKDFEGLTWH